MENNEFVEIKPFLPEDPKIRSIEFFQQMAQRRSIRHFSNRSVDSEILLNAIKTAGTAPSGANKQPWHFALIINQDLKNKIRIAAEATEYDFYHHRAPESWLQDLKVFKTNHEKPYLSDAPALIAIFSRSQVQCTEKAEKTYYPLESTGIAVGFLLTALHQSGISTLTHTPRPLNFLNSLLDLDSSYKPFMIVVAGYPQSPTMVPNIQRKPVSEIMTVY